MVYVRYEARSLTTDMKCYPELTYIMLTTTLQMDDDWVDAIQLRVTTHVHALCSANLSQITIGLLRALVT
jgi:hypothetical protein